MTAGVALTDATFAEFVRSADRPVLIDFWGAWCQPCRVFDPILEELARTDGRFVLASVDIDANTELVLRYGVTSAPTLVLLDDAEVVWRSVGARGARRLADDLDPHLGGQVSRPVADASG